MPKIIGLRLVPGGGRNRVTNKTWRERLAAAVERDGRSNRALSFAAKLHETAVWEMLNAGKEPGIEKLLAVCNALQVPISFILEGIERSPETERLLRAYSRLPKEQQEAFLDFLERQKLR